jgi:hypothetical protein
MGTLNPKYREGNYKGKKGKVKKREQSRREVVSMVTRHGCAG